MPGRPGLGCNRVVRPRWAASSGNTASTDTGLAGVVLVIRGPYAAGRPARERIAASPCNRRTPARSSTRMPLPLALMAKAVLDGRGLADRLVGDGDPAVRAAAQDLMAAIDNHACKTCRPT